MYVQGTCPFFRRISDICNLPCYANESGTLDRAQTSFLRDLGISESDALMQLNSSPLSTRRDIAMLGVIHRAVTGRGPPQLRLFLQPPTSRNSGRRHNFHTEVVLHGQYLEIAKRSCLGLILVYNGLSREVVDDRCCVKTFQGRLQHIVKQRAEDGFHDWPLSFSCC